MASETEQKTVQVGDSIKVHYTGTFEDGTVFDSSIGHDPLMFKVGEGKLIRGFENGVVGKALNQEFSIILQPEEAYGPKDEKLIQDVPIAAIKDKLEPKVGMVLALKIPFGGGAVANATITEVGTETFKLDLNPPMAGKVLNFKITVVEIY